MSPVEACRGAGGWTPLAKAWLLALPLSLLLTAIELPSTVSMGADILETHFLPRYNLYSEYCCWGSSIVVAR